MQIPLILSVLSDDRPGVVSSVANVVAINGGNWLDCRLMRLAGKFTGVICVAVNQHQRAALVQALGDLSVTGIRVSIDDAMADVISHHGLGEFTLVGADRAGLVSEISRSFSQRGINVVELTTECTSMPYSGEPLFSAAGVVELPQGFEAVEMEDMLERIANDLGMDFTFSAVVEPPPKS